MKNKLILIIIFFLSLSNINAEMTQSKISFLLEYMGASTAIGFNVEYSPNNNLDFGLGTIASIRPFAEIHLYGRYNFIDYLISPFVQTSVTFISPGQIDDNTDWFLARIETGAKIKFGKNWFLGLGGGYQIIGNEGLLVPTHYNRFYPTLFIGWSPIKL